jgi:dTDP-4-dehydrorhamnose reductase
MTRWLVTGAGGMLGRDVVAVLRDRGEDVAGLGRGALDVTDQVAVLAAFSRHRPDVVVNCAAWTGVDAAQTAQAQAQAVNGRGAENVAMACAVTGSRLVQVSTDYVFSGDGGAPYAEDDLPAPRTAYGRTKLAGERAVRRRLPDSSLVVRTAWLYGGTGPSFVHTMMRLCGSRPTVDVVADQHGQPTWTVDVAVQIAALTGAGAPAGIYHATSSDPATWFELATEIFVLLGADPARVRPTTSSGCSRPAPRPAYSVLGHDRHALAGIDPIGDWRDALHRAWPSLSRPPT